MAQLKRRSHLRAGFLPAAVALSLPLALGACSGGKPAATSSPPPPPPMSIPATGATPTTSAPSTGQPSTTPVTAAPSATSSTTAGTNYHAQYLNDVAAPDTYSTSIRSATQAMLDKLANLVTTNASELRQQSWPASARTDIYNLAGALDGLASDLRAGTVTGLSLVSADAMRVRADLGLPPPPAENQW